MKSKHEENSKGLSMDLDGFNLIVPVMATTSHSLEGGPTVQQSVPEDYFIAANLLEALQRLNGRDLEFVMKTYLPIKLIVAKNASRFVFMESLDLVSTKMNPLQDSRLDEIIDLIEEASSKDEIIEAIDFFSEALESLKEKREVTVAGLISDEHDFSM